MSRPKYSPDIIRRYREMDAANAFRRGITEQVPVDLDIDRVTVSCGHSKEIHALLVVASAGKLDCGTCQNEWLTKAVEDEKRESQQRMAGVKDRIDKLLRPGGEEK